MEGGTRTRPVLGFRFWESQRKSDPCSGTLGEDKLLDLFSARLQFPGPSVKYRIVHDIQAFVDFPAHLLHKTTALSLYGAGQ